MKIGVLSDVHGNFTALKSVLHDLKDKKINKLIILGDMIMKGPMPSEVLKILKNGDFEILSWIKGNTDLWFQEFNYNSAPDKSEIENFTYYKYAVDHLINDEIHFINSLPLSETLKINNISILCVHGTPKSIVEAIDSTVPDNEIKKAMDNVTEDIVLSGHSHTSFIGECGNIKIFNVGSVGNQVGEDKRISYGILDFSDGQVKLFNERLEYDRNESFENAKDLNFPYIEKYKENLGLKI